VNTSGKEFIMRKNALIAATTLVLALGASAAFAQPSANSEQGRPDQFAVAAQPQAGAWAYYQDQAPAYAPEANSDTSSWPILQVPANHGKN
jgi:hypothetical protein